ncbi:hypothetical protein [Salinibacter grassmerensis]|uniref:hypothetical protein n=1 Tax=Salinibacter grassmerensis TaxID=3040353 RepID=UPI0021E7BE14|nr:hypothetical protein [Salinibacter grassmerensis]
MAQLSDRAAIDEMLTELIITPQIPKDSIRRVEVVDVTGNGYGPDDLVVVYPSGETFNIDPSLVTGRVQDIMRSWSLESEFQYDGANAPAETFRPDTAQADTADADIGEAQQPPRGRPQSEEWAEDEIMADVLETVQRNYQGEAVSLLLEKDANGFTFEMWDYTPQAMQYQAAPGGPPDTVQTRDLVYVVRSDSVIYDVVYINRTVEETEYIPQGPTSALPEEQRNGPEEEAVPSGAASPRKP